MSRARWLVLMVVTVVVSGAVGLVVLQRVQQERVVATTAPAQPTAGLDEVLAGDHLVFRSTSRDSTYGRVAVVSLDDPSGARAVTDVECERVFSAAGTNLCLSADRGVVTTYRTQVLDQRFELREDLPLTGLPSRARLSRDGRYAATTSFVTGHSYSGGDFSTETVVRDLDGTTPVLNVQTFELRVDGAVTTADDVNVWGVTFADDGDTFFATAASGGTTWLVEGSLAGQTLVSLRTDAECPSLSPDGTRVAYKKRGEAVDGTWRLAVLDLATGEEQLLAETRSVDDQVEWLDDDHVLYGLPREGAEAAVTDVWVQGVENDEPAEVLVAEAWSPAVVR